MEYVVLGIGILNALLLIIILITNLMKKNKNEDISERLGKFATDLTKEIGEFKYDFSKSLQKDFKEMGEVLERRLNNINDKVQERLDQNFEKTNKTFATVLERISKIDEAQKKIDSLSNDTVRLQSVLTDKKTRGIFGETNLNYILDSVFGKNDQIYREQHTLSNGSIADTILFMDEGVVVEEGPPEDIFTRPQFERTAQFLTL